MLITTLVVSFYRDGRGSVNVKLWFLVVYVRCEVLCRSVVLFQTRYFKRPLSPAPHTLHEKTSRAIAYSPDTTPAYPHLTSNLQQPKVCRTSNSQH